MITIEKVFYLPQFSHDRFHEPDRHIGLIDTGQLLIPLPVVLQNAVDQSDFSLDDLHPVFQCFAVKFRDSYVINVNSTVFTDFSCLKNIA